MTMKACARAAHYHVSPGLAVLQVVAVQIGPLAFGLACASLVWGFWGGLYWVVPGMLFTFVGAMFVSWVLLIEIRRGLANARGCLRAKVPDAKRRRFWCLFRYMPMQTGRRMRGWLTQ